MSPSGTDQKVLDGLAPVYTPCDITDHFCTVVHVQHPPDLHTPVRVSIDLKVRRVAAYLLDGALFLSLAAPSVWFALPPDSRKSFATSLFDKSLDLAALGLTPSDILDGKTPTRVLLAVLLLCVWGIGWSFYRVLGVRFDVSVGKRLLGVVVKSVSDPSASPTWRMALTRLAPGTALGMLPIPGSGYFGYLAALWRRDGVGWHDRAAGTVVVRRAPRR